MTSRLTSASGTGSPGRGRWPGGRYACWPPPRTRRGVPGSASGWTRLGCASCPPGPGIRARRPARRRSRLRGVAMACPTGTSCSSARSSRARRSTGSWPRCPPVRRSWSWVRAGWPTRCAGRGCISSGPSTAPRRARSTPARWRSCCRPGARATGIRRSRAMRTARRRSCPTCPRCARPPARGPCTCRRATWARSPPPFSEVASDEALRARLVAGGAAALATRSWEAAGAALHAALEEAAGA